MIRREALKSCSGVHGDARVDVHSDSAADFLFHFFSIKRRVAQEQRAYQIWQLTALGNWMKTHQLCDSPTCRVRVGGAVVLFIETSALIRIVKTHESLPSVGAHF